jgi:hypothetical protein
LDRVGKMDRYAGRIELSDGNRAAFLLTLATHGRAAVEWAFEQSPTQENLEEAGAALELVFERVLGGAVTSLEYVLDGNPEVARQTSEAFLRGVSSN